MGLLNKIVTAIRGSAREMGESIVDANSTRIFEQQIKDAESSVEHAKQDLTSVLAKEMQAAREIERLQDEISKHEGYAKEALKKNDENLAMEVAQRIAEFTSQLTIQKKTQENFADHANHLKEMIRQTDESLADMNRQLALVKATDSVQKATAAITDNFANSHSSLMTAQESLDRIQKRQQEMDDRLKAGESLKAEFSGQALDDKLREAGITDNKNSAADILARLKETQDNV